jgi:hypothetical protein
MHYNIILVAASSLFLSRISAECLQNNGNNGVMMKCSWYGTSPLCGSYPSSQLGNWDGKQQLYHWTRYDSVDDLWKRNQITDSCYKDYGAACVSGWKRLWCCKYVPFWVWEQSDKLLDAPNPPTMAEEVGPGHEGHFEHEDHEVYGDQEPVFAKHESADIKIGHGRIRVAEIVVELN